MAVQSIQEIKTQILTKKAEYEALDGLNSTSKVSIYGLLAYIVSASIWLLYKFFDLFKVETDEKIANQKILGLLWLRDKALEYRHGHPLIEEDYKAFYSDEGYTEEEIENAQIIKRASVIEREVENRTFVFVKCATEIDGELAKLTDAQKEGVADYFRRIKGAGTKLEVFSDDPDDLRLTIDFFYDPLVLTETGARIDGSSNTPVADAVRNYLKNLKFNGEYSNAELEDILQLIPGCSDGEAYVKGASYNFQTPAYYLAIHDSVVANSGYMSITDENLIINFIAKTVVS